MDETTPTSPVRGHWWSVSPSIDKSTSYLRFPELDEHISQCNTDGIENRTCMNSPASVVLPPRTVSEPNTGSSTTSPRTFSASTCSSATEGCTHARRRSDASRSLEMEPILLRARAPDLATGPCEQENLVFRVSS